MTSAIAVGGVGEVRREAAPLPMKDKVTIGLICFFAAVAFTLELYFLVFNDSLEQRSNILVNLLALYWPADYTYKISGWPIEKCFTVALETVNVGITQLLGCVLVYGIVKRRRWRHPLQLTLGTYTFYGTFLYYYVAHLSGYQVFEYKGLYPYLMFYLCNLPWFAGYLWMAWQSFRAISRQLGAAR